MKIKITGIPAIEKGLHRQNKVYGKAFASILPTIASEILSESIPMTPVDTGALRASGDYFVQGSGWNAVAVVGFGFPVSGFFKGNRERVPSDYAVYQHDEPYEQKYLEYAVDNKFDDIGFLFWQEIARA
jgi:hypothetical protein